MTPKKVNVILKIALASLIVVTAAGLYVANQKLTAVAGKTSRLRAEITLSQNQVDAYSLTKVKVDTLGYANELADKVLPDKAEQSVIVAEVSQFALRAGVGVAQISFADKDVTAANGKKTVVSKDVEVIPINVQLKEGSKYENILAFLRYIENNQRRMQVVTIDLKPDDKDRTQLSTVTVLLNLYVKKVDVGKKQ